LLLYGLNTMFLASLASYRFSSYSQVRVRVGFRVRLSVRVRVRVRVHLASHRFSSYSQALIVRISFHLYLPHISPISPLHLPYTSQALIVLISFHLLTGFAFFVCAFVF